MKQNFFASSWLITEINVLYRLDVVTIIIISVVIIIIIIITTSTMLNHSIMPVFSMLTQGDPPVLQTKKMHNRKIMWPFLII